LGGVEVGNGQNSDLRIKEWKRESTIMKKRMHKLIPPMEKISLSNDRDCVSFS